MLGILLLRSRPSQPVVAVLAHLFLVNGVISGLYGLHAADIAIAGMSGRLRHQAAILEAGTNLLILWLALCYPRPVSWLPKWPAVTAPIVTLGIAVIIDALTGAGLGRVRGPGPLDLTDAVLVYGVFDLVFIVLLLRWTHAWLRPMEARDREQFMLLFAVFGMRATHMSVLIPAIEIQRMAARDLSTPALWFMIAMGITILATGIYCLARILLHENRLPSQLHRLHLVVTVFLFIGVAEGMLNATMAAWGNIEWWHAVTLRYDVMIARPGMVWLAFPALHGGLQGLRRNQVVLGLIGGLGATSIVWGTDATLLWTGLGFGLAAALVTAALTPFWLSRLDLWRNPESGNQGATAT